MRFLGVMEKDENGDTPKGVNLSLSPFVLFTPNSDQIAVISATKKGTAYLIRENGRMILYFCRPFGEQAIAGQVNGNITDIMQFLEEEINGTIH